MASQKTMSLALSFSAKPFHNLTGIQLPGLSIQTQKHTLELLKKNHENFAIFFNDLGYHNHFVHHVLSAYACGGSEQLLDKIYETNASYQRRLKAPKLTITRENWKEHLGNHDMWSEYLEFFDKLVNEEGMEKVFHEFAFHPSLFSRLFSGVFHPLIHLGYGVEFQIPMIVSEGLALAAMHPNPYDKVANEEFMSLKGAEKKSAMDILKETQKDKRFDFIVYSEKVKDEEIMQKAGDAMVEILSQWTIPATEEGVQEALFDLYQACILVHGATAFRPNQKKIQIDFFLMHGLTSILMVSTILPFVALENRVQLLRAHFAALVGEYVSRGRPQFDADSLLKYTPKTLSDEPNPWLDIVKASLLDTGEAHVIKVIRALLKAEREWPAQGKENIYVKAAQLTLEATKQFGWGGDIGFDEAWQ